MNITAENLDAFQQSLIKTTTNPVVFEINDSLDLRIISNLKITKLLEYQGEVIGGIFFKENVLFLQLSSLAPTVTVIGVLPEVNLVINAANDVVLQDLGEDLFEVGVKATNITFSGTMKGNKFVLDAQENLTIDAKITSQEIECKAKIIRHFGEIMTIGTIVFEGGLFF